MSENTVLPEKIFSRIKRHTEQGDQMMQAENFNQAVKEYQKAWNLLPEPRQLWQISTWIKVAQSEALITMENYTAAKEKILEGIICPGAVDNPLVHLLLGIACYETGDMDCAGKELQIAYELQGEDIFADEDEKYRQLIKTS